MSTVCCGYCAHTFERDDPKRERGRCPLCGASWSGLGPYPDWDPPQSNVASQENPTSNPYESLKLAEVEKILGVTRRTVLRYITEGSAAGKLRAYKVNAYWRVKRADLDDFLARQVRNT